MRASGWPQGAGLRTERWGGRAPTTRACCRTGRTRRACSCSAGATSLELHVFGKNRTAIGMYEAAGYEVVTQQMRKQL